MTSASSRLASSRALAKASPAIAIDGAEAIVRALEQQDVRMVAGIPGGALLPLYDALARCSRIRHILARHEQAAGFIAQGMARMTGRPGVCLATSGPGVTNIITALADAKLDSIPLVCITGQVPTHLIGTDAFQEVATVELAKPVTKAAYFARSAEELAALIAEAFHVAQSGRPGPVLIDVPKDVQLQKCSTSETACQISPVSLPDARDQFGQAAAMLLAAHRPVIYAGGGVVKAKAQLALQRLAESTGTPVTTTLMAMGALRHDHPLNLGMLGMHAAIHTHRMLEECDFVLALGARFDDRATGDPQRFLSNAKIVHIDIDARELGKIKRPDLAIHADAWRALTEINACIPTDSCAARATWLGRLAELRRQMSSEGQDREPARLLRALGSALPHDTILTTDVGQHQMWVAQHYPFVRADRWLTSGGLGTMGFGLPAAIGAALVEPEATVVCLTGDGSLLMNIQELATLAELNLNVKIVVFDNASLGMVRQQQRLFYRQRYSASDFEAPSDFLHIANAFKVPSAELSSDPTHAGWALFKRRGPALLRVTIAVAEMVLPMVAPGAANIDAIAAFD